MPNKTVGSRKQLAESEQGTSFIPTLTLAKSGWQPRNYQVEAMFEISRRVAEARKRRVPKSQIEKGLGGYATLNIGEFVVTYRWLDKQKQAIFKGHQEEISGGIVAKVEEHIVKVLKDMSSYGPGKGGEQIRKQILSQFQTGGFVDSELSVVGGGGRKFPEIS